MLLCKINGILTIMKTNYHPSWFFSMHLEFYRNLKSPDPNFFFQNLSIHPQMTPKTREIEKFQERPRKMTWKPVPGSNLFLSRSLPLSRHGLRLLSDPLRASWFLPLWLSPLTGPPGGPVRSAEHRLRHARRILGVKFEFRKKYLWVRTLKKTLKST